MTQPENDLVTVCTDEDPESFAGDEVSDESALGEYAYLAQPEMAILAEDEEA